MQSELLWLSTCLKYAVCLSACFCPHFFSLITAQIKFRHQLLGTSTIFLTTYTVDTGRSVYHFFAIYSIHSNEIHNVAALIVY